MSFARPQLVLLSAILVLGVLSACNTAPGDTSDDPVPPSAPTVLSITPGPGYVEIAWEHSGDDASAYIVYRAEAEDEDPSPGALGDVHGAFQGSGSADRSIVATSANAWQPVGAVDAEARVYRDSTSADGVSYFYAVTARDEGGLESPLPEPSGNPIRAEPVGSAVGTNPDPERYLAVIVRNFIGNAVAGARVSANLISADGSGSFFGPNNIRTDTNGVALIHDFGTSWPPAGAFNLSILVDYDGLSPGATFTTYENIELPGTIDIDPSSATLTSVPVSLADAGQPFEGAIQPVATFDGTRHVSSGFLRLTTGTLRMAPGEYLVLVTHPREPNPFSLSAPLVVPGDTEFRFDAANVTDAVTLLTPFDTTGVDRALTGLSITAERRDNWRQGMFIPAAGQTSRHSPGLYQLSATAQLVDDGGTTWRYSLRPSVIADAIDLDMTTAGASYEHQLGGAAQLQLVHNPVSQWSPPLRTTYVPGDRVFIAGRFFDAKGNHLTPFANHQVPCGLTVRDPSGTIVLHNTGDWQNFLRSGSQPASYLIDESAPKGTYSAEALCNLGAYASGVTGGVTFIVE